MYQNFPNHNDQSFFEKSCVSLKKEIDSTIECSQNGHETTIYGVEIDIQEDKFVSELFELTPDIELYSLIIEGRKIEGQTLYLLFLIFKDMNQNMILNPKKSRTGSSSKISLAHLNFKMLKEKIPKFSQSMKKLRLAVARIFMMILQYHAMKFRKNIQYLRLK